MSLPALPLPCYLVEWYAPTPCEMALDRAVSALQRGAAALSDAGSQVCLIDMLAVPTDDYVFTASSAAHVAQACRQAGLPAQRLTAALDARLPFPPRRPAVSS